MLLVKVWVVLAATRTSNALPQNTSTCNTPMYPGIRFNQADVAPSVKVSDFRACCAACQATAGCHVYTYNGEGTCYLKAGPNQPSPSDKAVSSIVGPLQPCSTFGSKKTCPKWCSWDGSACKTVPIPPPGPPPPPPGPHPPRPPPPSPFPPAPPPVPPAERSWMDTSLAPEARAAKLLAAMVLQEKLHMLHGNNTMKPYVGAVVGNDRLGIPSLNLNDGPQGFRGQGTPATSTAFPSGLTIAATWDPGSALLWGETMGEEFRDKGSNVQLGPGLCVSRLPKNGRNFEYMSGEDPYLGASLVPSAVSGIQSKGVIANAKHWVDNSQETNRSTNIANIDERTQMEIYYPPFEAAVKAGVGSIMCSYNRISITDTGTNNAWSCENPDTLLRDLRGRLNFSGWVMSDWGATHKGTPHNGLDQSMPGGNDANLLAVMQAGNMTEADVDESVTRVLFPMFKFGLFDAKPNASRNNLANVTSEAHNLATRKLAAAAMVLLQNKDSILPLNDSGTTKIAVIGCEAAGCQGPGSTKVHGGGSGQVFPYYISAPLDAVRGRFPPASQNLTVLYDDASNASAAVETASQADVAIVFIATESGEGKDRRSLSFPGVPYAGIDYDELVTMVATQQSKAKVVVVMVSPGAVLTPWRDSVDAIIAAFNPGQEYGNAISEILFGDRSPAGHLPTTFPAVVDQIPFTQKQWPGLPAPADPKKYPGMIGANGSSWYTEKLEIGYRYYDAHRLEPAFPFGHGLTYTDFEYSALAANRTVVSFTLKNVGAVDGAACPQLYIEFPAAAGEPPKQLKRYKQVMLPAGKSVTVTFDLDDRALSVWSVAKQAWTIPAGSFVAHLGASSRDIKLNATI